MDIIQLKQKIVSNTLSDDILVLKYPDNKFLCNQYIDIICKNKNLKKVYINSLLDLPEEDDFFGLTADSLYVLDVEKLTEYPSNNLKNVVILTKVLPDNLEVDYVDMSKLINWQMEDYVAVMVPGLDVKECEWLCKICKYDIYRIDQECRKLKLFPEGAQKSIFNEINHENGYSDLTDQNIFNFTNAIILKELDVVGSLIPDLESADLEPLGCVTILLKKFRQMTEFLLNPKATPKSVNMSEKQFHYLRNHPEKYSAFNEKEILKNIEFLSEIDYKIKSGNLELNREQLLAYITTKVLI